MMLTVFFDNQGIVHKEFVQEGCTVNAEYYKGALDCLISRIRRVPPARQRPSAFGSNNSTVSDSKTSRNIEPPPNPPYSPDLSPPTTSCSRR